MVAFSLGFTIGFFRATLSSRAASLLIQAVPARAVDLIRFLPDSFATILILNYFKFGWQKLFAANNI